MAQTQQQDEQAHRLTQPDAGDYTLYVQAGTSPFHRCRSASTGGRWCAVSAG